MTTSHCFFIWFLFSSLYWGWKPWSYVFRPRHHKVFLCCRAGIEAINREALHLRLFVVEPAYCLRHLSISPWRLAAGTKEAPLCLPRCRCTVLVWSGCFLQPSWWNGDRRQHTPCLWRRGWGMWVHLLHALRNTVHAVACFIYSAFGPHSWLVPAYCSLPCVSWRCRAFLERLSPIHVAEQMQRHGMISTPHVREQMHTHKVDNLLHCSLPSINACSTLWGFMAWGSIF